MEYSFLIITLTLIGLCAGSFVGAMVWRLRAGQLRDDRDNKEVYDHQQYNRLKKVLGNSLLQDRSMCLSCSYKLKWFDMIPVVSWVLLRGKCRKCRHSIGITELLLEIGLALFFVLSFVFWPYQLDAFLEITRFVSWLIAGVALAILFVYDLRWFILPDVMSFSLIGIALVGAIANVILSAEPIGAIASILMAVLIMSGLYYVLYVISKGKWIGFGDIKLGIGLALLLSDWQLAFLALFAANLIGCMIVIPLMLIGKLKRNSHVPLGPLLILGTIFAQISGPSVIEWYINTLI